MDNVVCSCLKCGSELGNFKNSWIGIGNSYFSPVYPPTAYISGFEATGDVFAKGPDGSAVQNSVLQDLACKKCATVVGLRCDDAPDGHLLKKNQLILRLAEMNVVSDQSGDKAVISVQQKIPLLAPGAKKLPAVRRAATVQPPPRAQPSNSLVEYDKQKSANGNMLPPPAEDSSRKNLTKFATWAEDAINDQQKEIDYIGGAVARIEKDMKSLKEFMSEVRAELAATRATRKTQEDLKEEQLAWLREDFKELRQENGDFQQDMREEELPSIHNELQQLRQELDSNNRLTELPDLGSLQSIDGVNGFRESVMRIDRKFNEVDGLKMELERLQKRLSAIEEKRQDSFVSPGTRMNHPETHDGPSVADGQARSASTRARQQPRLMFETLNAAAARSRTAGLASPTPPGAFPDSILDLDTPRQDLAAQSGARPRQPKPRRAENELEVAETVSPKPILVQKWSYTGLRKWRGVNAAFQSFALEYPKLGAVSESIKVLEDYVNKSNIQNSSHAQKHGKVALVEETTEYPGSCLDEPEPSLPKRKHDQVEDTMEQLPSETLTKRRKRSSMPAGKDQSTIISSDDGSPELGRESKFRSGPKKRYPATTDELESALEPLPANLSTLNKRPSSGRLRNSSLGGGESSNGPSTSSPFQNLNIPAQRLSGPEAIYGKSRNTSGTLLTPRCKMNERSTRQRTVSNKENEMLPSVRRDHTTLGENTAARSISSRDATTARSAVPAYLTESTHCSVSPNYDPSRPFGCGACGKRYKNLEGLTNHKEHTLCYDNEDGVIAKEFHCPTCKKSVKTQEGLNYHISQSPTCKDSQGKQTKGVFAPRHRRKRKSLERQELVSLGKVNQGDAGLAGETETTPAVAVPKRNAVLQSIEADDGPIPGSFPEDIDTPASEAAEVRGSSQIEEVDVDSRKPFKCGSCGKRYKNSNGLKYHKQHSSCTDHPDDIIPADFKCPFCSKGLTQLGLQYHLANSLSCRNSKEGEGKKKVAAREYDWEQRERETQRRMEVLAARERLVKETLERD